MLAKTILLFGSAGFAHAGFAQGVEISGTGAFNWNSASAWGGLAVPTALLTTEIATNAQVTVSSDVVTAGLTLGATATAGTEIIVEAAKFTVKAMTWRNGEVKVNADGDFFVDGVATLEASSSTNVTQQIKGQGNGKVTMGATGKISLDTDANLVIESIVIAGGSYEAKAGALLTLALNNSLTVATEFYGAGSCAVTGTLAVAAAANFSADAEVRASGSLEITGAGSVTVAANAMLSVKGGVLARTSTNAAAKVIVEADAALVFGGTTQATVRGGIYSLVAASSKMAVDASASVAVEAEASITGSGSLEVSGELRANAKFTTAAATTVKASGKLLIGAGVQAAFGAVTFASGTTCGLKSSATAFTKVTATGAVTLAGTLELEFDGDFKPTKKVTLMTATSISGKFATVTITTSASAGRRLLANDGEVTYGDTEVYYTPKGSDFSATSHVAPVAGAFAVFAALMAAIMA